MIFGQLIEHNKKISFLFHIYVGEKTFSKKSKLSVSLDQQAEFIKSILTVCPSRWLWKQIETKVLRTFTSNKSFAFIPFFDLIKTKRVLKLLSMAHFLHDSWRRRILTLHSIKWPNFVVWLPLILGILGNVCIAIACFWN